EFSVYLVVGTLAIQMHVQLAQERSEGVGVSQLRCFPGPVGYLEQVVKTIGSTVCCRLENALISNFLSNKSVLWIGPVYHRQRFCVRPESSDHLVAIDRVETKDAEWVGVIRSE
ncbi:MAG TPA: hypothetical protein VHY59_12460, partial [Chthoniobacterales bacterium]|nr:hypothetical protein [Chthoniobacterales bacterium]